MRWACENSLYRMQERFRLLFRNLPFRPLAWLLRACVFPTGSPTATRDRIDHEAAAILLRPGQPETDSHRASSSVTTRRCARRDRQAFAQAAWSRRSKRRCATRAVPACCADGLPRMGDRGRGRRPDLCCRCRRAGKDADPAPQVVMVDSFAHYGKRYARRPPTADRPAIYAV